MAGCSDPEPPGEAESSEGDRSAVPVAATATPDPTAAAAEATAETPIEGDDWASANGGPANTRARDSSITSDSVSNLAEAWSVPLPGRGPYGAAAGAPVVADGVVYVQDLAGNVLAVDLESGEELWRHMVQVPIAGPNGPAVSGGLVVASFAFGVLKALDAATGEVVWSAVMEKDGFQPLIWEDLVLVGTGNLAHVFGNSGFIHAFDLQTGELRWSFQVVEEGFWGDPNLNSGGGVWYQPAIDEERGLAYFGTGNAGPYPGTVQYPNGSSRPGPNLYTSSLVALDLETGELAWYYQAVEHGLFDLDFQSPPILARHTDGAGEVRDLVVGSGKLGRVVALDRDTNEVVWATEVGIHQNDRVEEIPPGERLEVYPGIYGGVETPMAAAGGRIFVPVVNLATTHSATGHGATDGSSALLNATANTTLSNGSGELVALDLLTGAEIWSAPLPSMPFGGATVVGDLVFTATFDGVITAHAVADGAEVWRMEAGGGINAWPAVEDDTIIWPVGLGPSPRMLALRVEEGSIPSVTVESEGER